jgi:DNA-directed RNA polymerase specialized sigma24 family protein
MDRAVRESLERLRRQPARFRRFYDKLRRDFHRLARRSYSWAYDTEIDESLNDAFVALFVQNKGEFSTAPQIVSDPLAFETALAAYLIGAGRFKLLTRLRERAKREDHERPLDDDGEILSGHADTAPDAAWSDAEPFPTPEDSHEQTRRARILARCMEKLTVLARQTIALALRGYTDVEIQARIGSTSAVAVRRRVSETKALLIDCARQGAQEA